MKTSKFSFLVTGLLALALSATSCKTDSIAPVKTNGNGNNNNGTGNTGGGNTNNSGVHHVDPKMVGTWIWTDSGDAASYDDNGTYHGSLYGMATEYKIGADGYGTAYSHIYSTIGSGTSLVVDITSQGFFETDDQGHLGYFPTSGKYESSSGTYRDLYTSELWDANANTGKSFVYQKLVVTSQGGRACFQVTSSNDITDTYFKVN